MDEPMIEPTALSDEKLTPQVTDTLREDAADAPTVEDAACATDTPASEPMEDSSIDYAALAEEDLLQLKALFPELASLHSLTALHDPVRYGELRDLGLSPREAYLATEGGRRGRDNRAHLTGFVPRTTLHTGDSIAPSELAAARELFSGLSDGEIRRLYKRVSGS